MLNDLYQELILDHNKNPQNKRAMDDASAHAAGHNPLCGDSVEIFIRLNGDIVEDVSFNGHGCAISTASASLMTEAMRGKTLAEAKELFEKFHAMITEENPVDSFNEDEKLAALSGVNQYPMRVKCATLAWHTFQAAIDGRDEISTE